MQERQPSGCLTVWGRNGQGHSLHTISRLNHPPQTSRTTSVFHRRGGPMCPPSGNTFRFPPSEANAYHLGLRGNGTVWEHIPVVPHVQPIQTAHHGWTHGPAPTHRWGRIARTGIFWWTGCLRGGMAKAIPYEPGYPAPSRCFTVVADPCVYPAETPSGFLHLVRMRIIYRPGDPWRRPRLWLLSQSCESYRHL